MLLSICFFIIGFIGSCMIGNYHVQFCEKGGSLMRKFNPYSLATLNRFFSLHVRFCAVLVFGFIKTINYFDGIVRRSGLGCIEKIQLNIASLQEEVMMIKPFNWTSLWLLLFMVKAWLLKVESRDVLSKELYHFNGNRINSRYIFGNVNKMYIKRRNQPAFSWDKEINLQPKKSVETNYRTKGWPNKSDLNGYRVGIVPLIHRPVSMRRPTGLFVVSRLRYHSGWNEHKISKRLA